MIIYLLFLGVGKSLTAQDITTTINGVSGVIIGKRYTLTLTNLEQLEKSKEQKTKDYSGILTVAIKQGVVKDITGNKNAGTTITAGVDIPGGTGNGVIVDVVSPVFEKVENGISNTNDGSVSMKIKATDTYYDKDSILTAQNIEVYINGALESKNVSVEKGNTLTETRTINNATQTVVYGQEYNIKVSGLTLEDVSQVKIKIKENAIKDLNDNKNIATQFILMNCLKATNTETTENSPFLGNTKIKRKDIESITFVSNTNDKNNTAWDASALNDKSIIAWYKDSDGNGAYEVYIGSNETINANTNSSYLFSYVGYDTNASKNKLINNLSILRTNNVTNMDNMFQFLGYNAMTSIDLESNFVTDKVTTMKEMFKNTGYNNLTSINFGTNFNTAQCTNMASMFEGFGYNKLSTLTIPNTFNTSKVTKMQSMFKNMGHNALKGFVLSDNFTTASVQEMQSMFEECGYNELTAMNLKSKFDVSSVTDMQAMFKNFGYMKLQSLDLGTKFNTKLAQNMKEMFYGCGFTSMTSINLADNFNTQNVTNMESMFENCGNAKLPTLKLGKLFYTSKVTNMSKMFKNCGTTSLTELDLGPAFTYIAGVNTEFITNTGKDGKTTIYVGESIYSTMYKLKLNTNSTTTIDFTRGKINPKYTPYFVKVSNDINETTKEVNIFIKATNTYESKITSTIQTDNIKTYINGTETTTISKKIEKTEENATSITYKLTLSDFQDERMNKDLFKEWSGNISILIDPKVISDQYGNQNMNKIDDENGNWTDLIIKDTEVDKNQNNYMFADFIKPEITYKYSEETSNVNYEEKILTVKFDVADKYFKESNINLQSLKFNIGGELFNINVEQNSLTSEPIDAEGNVLSQSDIQSGAKQYGLKYTLVVKNLEQAKTGKLEKYNDYSGSVSILIPEKLVKDKSGNANIQKTITLGIDEPTGDNQNEQIVDVVDPTWNYVTSSIDRNNETVTITVNGTDKYFKSGSLKKSDIKVYLDDDQTTDLSAQLLTSVSEGVNLTEKRNKIDVQYGIQYQITLGNFKNLSGKVTIEIASGNLLDNYGNTNKTSTQIDVGNVNWVETGDDAISPKYTAFRNSIVDFIKPKITYKYEKLENSSNPNINYQNKTLTVTFDITDKHFLESTIKANDITVMIDGKNTTGKITKKLTSVNLEDGTGTRNTLVLSNIEQKELGEEGYVDFSGKVQLIFKEGVVADTSGNKNITTTITLDNDDGDDINNGVIVDVVDPIWSKGESTIFYEDKYVETEIIGSDHYYKSNTLTTDNITVYIDKKDGNGPVAVNEIKKELTLMETQSTYVKYKLKLTNFTDENQGILSIKITPNTLLDMYGNQNKENEFVIRNPNDANDAFQEGLVDFIPPEWHYNTSSIDRNNETVTFKFYGLDKNIDINRTESIPENLKQHIHIFVDDVEINTINKELSLESTDATRMYYKLVLSNFENYSGKVKITLDTNTLYDTSGNTNKETTLDVGNSEWVEEGDTNKEYTAFKNSVVDFIKPIITYDYQNHPSIQNTENRTLTVYFDVTDKQFLKSNLSQSDIQLIVDDKEINTAQISSLTSQTITNGMRYTLVVSNFEEETDEVVNYINYSGKVQVKIKEDVVKDTSGNGNNERIITLDYDNGDDEKNFEIVDLVRPYFHIEDLSADFVKKTATIKLRSTDKYYDFNSKLENLDNVEITTEKQDLKNTYNVTMTTAKITYGYEYTIIINGYAEEDDVTVKIPAGVVHDKYGNYNREISITKTIDNQKPLWKYKSIDASQLDSNGNISITIAGQDRYLNTDKSSLTTDKINIYQGKNLITGKVTMSLTGPVNSVEGKNKLMQYTLTISGLSGISDYTIVIAEKTLVDNSLNYSNTATFTFSKSAIGSKTFSEVTYFKNYTEYTNVNELYTVDETGSNVNSNTYTPSSLAEVWNDGKNKFFIEKFDYDNTTQEQQAQAFKAWAEADSEGNIIENAREYKLYDEIPASTKYLTATWQNANVIFVSSSGSNSNNGLSPGTPVKDIETAFSKLPASNDTSKNIIVLMTDITWNSNIKSTKNATITNLYAGTDYRKNGAKLTVDGNIYMNSNIVFDNIEIDSKSSTVSRDKYLYEQTASNMLICNYYDLTIGRGVTTSSTYTFGSIVGGYYGTLGSTSSQTRNLIVERGKYNAIITGSSLSSNNGTKINCADTVQIGSKKDGSRAQNNMLTITGYLGIAQNANYENAFDTINTQIKMYSGTFTGENGFNKSNENAAIYIRDINGNITNSSAIFKMYGGEISANIYAGSVNNSNSAQNILTELYFYGGNVKTGANIYGQGIKNNYKGSSKITLSGTANIQGNVYGGANSNNDTIYGTAITNINVSSSSCKIQGNIFGGSSSTNGTQIELQKGYINGATNINISAGTITGKIYGGGENAGIGTINSTLTEEQSNPGQTNINITGGTINNEIFGGSYQNYIGTATNITISGSPIIKSNIYGGGEQKTSNSIGIGYLDNSWYVNSNKNTNKNSKLQELYNTTNIQILGGTIGNANTNGVYGTNKQSSNTQMQSDTILEKSNIIIGDSGKTPNIKSKIYGSGIYDQVQESNITIISSNTQNKIDVYGGSNNPNTLNTSNINLNGANINAIYGGSNTNGTLEKSNIIVNSGTVSKIFGGSYKADVTNTEITIKRRKCNINIWRLRSKWKCRKIKNFDDNRNCKSCIWWRTYIKCYKFRNSSIWRNNL